MFLPNSLPRRLGLSRMAMAATLSALAVTCAPAANAGGDEYLARRDTITLGAADATETNKAVQAITRWPAASRHDRWSSDGERARTAIARYRAGRVITPKTLGGKTDAGGGGSTPETPDVPVQPGSTAPK